MDWFLYEMDLRHKRVIVDLKKLFEKLFVQIRFGTCTLFYVMQMLSLHETLLL